MNKIWMVLSLMMSLLLANVAVSAADLEVNTPTISAIKSSMQARYNELAPFFNNGVVGLTQDGKVAVKDASAIPLKDRGAVNSLVSAENTDRTNLYKEIAQANGHPEWQAEIQSTFASRWIDKAQAGWFYQKAGAWVKK